MPGWEIWVGFFAGVIPFIIGASEFAKRIVCACMHARCLLHCSHMTACGLAPPPRTTPFQPPLRTMPAPVAPPAHTAPCLPSPPPHPPSPRTTGAPAPPLTTPGPPPPHQVIQQRCTLCGGKGLVARGANALRKCPQVRTISSLCGGLAAFGCNFVFCVQCGGFFPWVSWKLFLTSTAAPGNGGELYLQRAQKTRGGAGLLTSIPCIMTRTAAPAKGEDRRPLLCTAFKPYKARR